MKWEQRAKLWTWKMLERIGHPDFIGFSESWKREIGSEGHL
jgi:hypothetical protein